MTTFEEIILNNCPPLEPVPTDTQPRLDKLAGLKAVVFDIYGTLFVSGSGDVGTATATNTAQALTEALSVSGFRGDLELAGQRGIRMLKDRILEWHAAARAERIDFPEVEITDIWNSILRVLDLDYSEPKPIHRLALEYECRVNPVFPMPGSRKILQNLKNQGLSLGIVSNAQFYTPLLFSAFFNNTLEEVGFDPECCIWSYRELKAKPSADLFPKLGKFLYANHEIQLSETLYVGNDMLNDIYCASQAGCKTALFAGDLRSLRLRENDERCSKLNADVVITDLDQLSEVIGVPA